MMWGMHMGYSSWGFFLTALLWIGLIALGIWLLARLFPGVGRRERLTGREGQTEGAEDSALEILRRRYARGELSKEEYETMRHDLAS